MEKNLPAFWWIYTCLGQKFPLGSILCLAAQFLMWGTLLNAEEKNGDFKKGGRGLAPPIVLGGQPGALLALPKGRYFLLFTLPLLTSICPAFNS